MSVEKGDKELGKTPVGLKVVDQRAREQNRLTYDAFVVVFTATPHAYTSQSSQDCFHSPYYLLAVC